MDKNRYLSIYVYALLVSLLLTRSISLLFAVACHPYIITATFENELHFLKILFI
jgi:hypothetical protein